LAETTVAYPRSRKPTRGRFPTSRGQPANWLHRAQAWTLLLQALGNPPGRQPQAHQRIYADDHLGDGPVLDLVRQLEAEGEADRLKAREVSEAFEHLWPRPRGLKGEIAG